MPSHLKSSAIRIEQKADRLREPQGVVSYDTAYFQPIPTSRRPSMSLPKSHSNPIRTGIRRTPSELQLREEEALADVRDYRMYSRIVGAIHRQQQHTDRLDVRFLNDECIANITRTRCLPVQESSSSDAEKGPSVSSSSSYWVDESMTAAQHRDWSVAPRRTVTPPVFHDESSMEDEAIFCMDL